MKAIPAVCLDRKYLLFSLFLLLLLISMAINVMIGSVSIPLVDLLGIISQRVTESTSGFIVWKIRLPRAIAAVLGGSFLAISGLLLQVFFRNPIVGPFILGISSGATLMVAVVMLSTLSLGMPALNPFFSTLAALMGAYGAMILILTIATRVRSGVTLLITGLMLGYLCHALTSVLVAFAEREKIKGFVLWQLGSFAGFKWLEIGILFLAGGVILIAVYGLSKPLNAFLLGEEYASTMGVNIRLFRFLILLCACALAGMVTAVAGPVAFVGLAVPHMARLCFATSDNRVLVPGTILLGGTITSLCDLVARWLFSPVELPISAITAFFGAPMVISLLMKRRTFL